jgi:hypothetical protein
MSFLNLLLNLKNNTKFLLKIYLNNILKLKSISMFQVGFEPTTSRFSALRSTAELSKRAQFNSTREYRARSGRPAHWYII